MRVDVDRLGALVAEHYLTVQAHPNPAHPLLIWNYTPKCQYERVWTPETLMCRGLITTADGTIVARPFPKFFNLEEHQGPIPDEPFEVFEKMDGSLGIVYWPETSAFPMVATRGSFTSDQAKWATGEVITRALTKGYPFKRDRTYLFEVIYPENRIVVDYGDRRDLVLLAVIDNETGRDLPLEDVGWPHVESYPVLAGHLKHLSTLKELAEPNREGFVVRFASGLRLKVKFDEYVRLHRLVTGLNTRTVWEMLAGGQDVEAIVRDVPEEFAAWVRATATDLQARFAEIEERCRRDFTGTRRAIAAYYQTTENPDVLFAMLDGKPYAERIWKMVKPEAAATFRVDPEAA